MRIQIKKGYTFKQAVKLWNKRKREQAKKSKKRTAYNIFVSMQLKQGKTMKQAIRAWNDLKKGKTKKRRKPKKKPAKKKTAAKRKTKTVKAKTRALKRSPKKRVVKRTVKRKRKKVSKKAKTKPVRVRKVTVEKPVVVTRDIFPEKKIAEIVEKAVKKSRAVQETTMKNLKQTISSKRVSTTVSGELSDEEIALNMVEVYFGDVARFGFKRSLSLDEIINAYLYSLMRIERKGIELREVKDVLNRKKVEEWRKNG